MEKFYCLIWVKTVLGEEKYGTGLDSSRFRNIGVETTIYEAESYFKTGLKTQKTSCIGELYKLKF